MLRISKKPPASLLCFFRMIPQFSYESVTDSCFTRLSSAIRVCPRATLAQNKGTGFLPWILDGGEYRAAGSFGDIEVTCFIELIGYG